MRGRLLSATAALFVALLASVGLASPALAHTSLAASDPVSGQVLAETPKQVKLTFTTPVEPSRFNVRLLQRDGVEVKLSGSGATIDGSDVTLTLPILDMGTYAVVWRSTDASGHLSAGQVFFSVGSESGMEVGLDAGKPWWADLLGSVPRFLSFAGAALLLGCWLLVAWMRRDESRDAAAAVGGAEGDGLPRPGEPEGRAAGEGDPERDAQAAAASGARLGLVRALAVALLALGLALMPVGALASVASVSGFSFEAVVDLYSSPPNAYGWLLLAAALLAAPFALRVPALSLPVVCLVVAGDALAGHLSATPQGPVLVPLVIAHLAAVVVWSGVPIAWLLTRPPGGYRFLLRHFTPVALASLLIVLVSGPAMWAVRTGSAGELLSSLLGDYGRTVAFKVLVLALVVVPLGLAHLAWTVRSSYRKAQARESGQEGPAPLPDPGNGTRLVRWEALALVAALAAGSLLAGMSPEPPRQSQESSLFTVASSWDECMSRSAEWEGRILCLDTYLEHLVKDEGSPQALRALNAKTDTGDSFALQNCHELAHKIGRAAWVRYQDLPEAMLKGQDNCDFGYMHGIIEGFSLGVDDDRLVPALAEQCDALPLDRNDHQVGQCYHGIGHAVARRLNLRMDEAFDMCRFFDSAERQKSRPDYWQQEFVSCGTGAIMEWTLRPGFQAEASLPIGAPGTTLALCQSLDEAFYEACFEYVTSPINSDKDKLVEVRDWCYENLDDPVACYRSIGRDLMWLTFNSGGALSEEESIGLCYHGDNQDAITGCLRWQLGSIVTIYHAIEPLDRACAFLDPGRQRSLCPGMRESMLKALAANQRGEDSVDG